MSSGPDPLRVLILGGTTEASALAHGLAGDARFAPLLSFAGRTRAPVLPPIPVRIGGFGGVDALAAVLRDFDLLVDATHPFAARISANAAAAARISLVTMLAIRRPAWEAQPGDPWNFVADLPAAVAALGQSPQRVLLTIGQQELRPFAAAPWHRYMVRSVEAPPDDILPGAAIITARGPFAVEDEIALLRRLDTQILVTKNSGGHRAKLDAARLLHIPVVMVARPAMPTEMETVPDAAGALHWLHGAASTRRGV